MMFVMLTWYEDNYWEWLFVSSHVKSSYIKHLSKKFWQLHVRALEILKYESVQPMTMTSSMSPISKKKIYVYITSHEN